MPRQRKVRLTVLVAPSLLDRYTALAARHHVARNELLRYALEHGYGQVVSWCRRNPALAGPDSLDPAASADGSALPPAGGASVDVSKQLRQYAVSLRSTNPAVDSETVRAMLAAQAAVFGLSPAVSVPLVADILAEHFPGESPSAVSPAASSDAAPLASPSPVPVDSDGDLLPELDPSAPEVELD